MMMSRNVSAKYNYDIKRTMSNCNKNDFPSLNLKKKKEIIITFSIYIICSFSYISFFIKIYVH